MAIRAHESKWFIDFCDSEVLDSFDTMQDYIRQTLVIARLQQKDTAGAKALLLEGMERLPWLYNSIYKALNLDVPKTIWGMQPRDDDEEFFVELYIHQTKSLWDNAQAASLLKEAAREAKKPNSQTFGSSPVVGRNAARFVYLDNTPSLMGHVPRDILSTSPNWEFDPLPPLLDENIFSYNSQKLPWEPPDQLRPRAHQDRHQPRQEFNRLVAGVRDPFARQELQRVLDEAMGGVEDINEVQEALVEPGRRQNDTRNEDEDGDEEADADVIPLNEPGLGLFQAMMEIFGGGPGGGIDPSPLEHADVLRDDSETVNRMPGTWTSESDDEMPPLVNGGDGAAED
jgi:hypothetical protein